MKSSLSKQIKYLEKMVEEVVGIPYGLIIKSSKSETEVKREVLARIQQNRLRKDAIIYLEKP